jgi:hypothetical protein
MAMSIKITPGCMALQFSTWAQWWSVIFKIFSQIPRHREVIKILATEYKHGTIQLCKSGLKFDEVKE